MKVEVRHRPAMAAARCILAPGEELKVESGAMMATSGGVTVQASTQGGVMKGLKRSVLGGESLFISTFTAPAQGGWVDVAHHLTEHRFGRPGTLEGRHAHEAEQVRADRPKRGCRPDETWRAPAPRQAMPMPEWTMMTLM